MKWLILKLMANCPLPKQVLIVISTKTLHNYICRHAGTKDSDFPRAKSENAIFNEDTDEEEDFDSDEGNVNETEMTCLRIKIADSLVASMS